MKSYPNDRRGIAPVLEYIFSFTVFILILSIYFTALGTLFPNYDTDTSQLEKKALIVADGLMGGTGLIMDRSVSDESKGDWESYTSKELNSANHIEVRSLGLATDNRSFGILEYDKISALTSKIDYSTFTDVYSIKGSTGLNLTIESLENDIFRITYGLDITDNSEHKVTVDRFCIIKNNEATITGKLSVKLFYGGAIR